MKTVVSNLLLVALVIGISSGFVNKPVATDVISVHDVVSVESPVGGAFLIFAGKNGGNIKMSELQGQTELSVDGCAMGSRIFTFALEINDSSRIKTLQAKSNVLSKEMVVALKGLAAGDSFEFKAMKAYLPDGKEMVEVHGKKFLIVKESTPNT